MSKLVRDNLLILTLLAATLLACLAPRLGLRLQELGVVPALIMAVFLCQGASIDGLTGQSALSGLRAGVWGLLVAHAAAPVCGWLAMRALGWQADDRVGFLLMCCMAPTLVSGVVITAQAHGDRTLALFLVVGLNLASVLTVPFNLRWTLAADIGLNPWSLLGKLVIYLLLPGLLGHWLRRQWPAFAQRHTPFIKYAPVVFLGVTVYISICQQADAVMHLTGGRLLALLVPAVGVHYALLALAYFGAPRLAGVGEPQRRAVAIIASQKTIPVAVAIWTTEFATTYPLALVPALVFHLSQIYGDGLLARWWVRRDRARAAAGGETGEEA